MVFITLGSQKFQFNRLLMAVDQQIAEGRIKDKVFAQIGYSDYIPQHYEYKPFLDREEFMEMQDKSDLIITHGGTGAIVGALKKDKKVIAVARLAKHGEHVDDHQLQLIKEFRNSNLICECKNCDKLYESIDIARRTEYNKYESNTEKIIADIDNFIRSLM